MTFQGGYKWNLDNNFRYLSFGTSAKRFESEKRLFLPLSDGTKYVLKAPGKEWNRDLSIPSVRIWYIECNNSIRNQNSMKFSFLTLAKRKLHNTVGQ